MNQLENNNPMSKRLYQAFQSLRSWSMADRASLYAVLGKAWVLISGSVILLLISQYFTPELQGFYFTFASLLALQSILEMGFYNVIINTASHEWAHLGLNENGYITGNPDALSRLVSLGRFIFRWYLVLSILFIVIVGSAGYIFFSGHPDNGIDWHTPWIALVFLTGVILLALPFNALLEGCNQVKTIYRFRLTQGILGSSAMCLAIVFGAGLWASVVYVTVMLLRDIYLLIVQYRRFFQPFFKPPDGPCINWVTDLWPMQWRISVTGIVSYFAFSLFNPVMFHYHGAVVAGQMGMTIQLAVAIQGMANSWLFTKVPRFGIFIAQKNYSSLDHMWLRTSLMSMSIMFAGSISAWFVVYELNLWKISLAQRLLDPLSVGLLLISKTIQTIGQCEGVYLRAHKREPIFISGVTHALIIGFLVWQLGSRFGPVGATLGDIVGVTVGVVWTTLIWRRCRKEWHTDKSVFI